MPTRLNRPLRFSIALIVGLFACARALVAEDEVEIIKQLAFIEQHLSEEGVLVGLQAPYDVQVTQDGRHVYVASQNDDAISYFGRDADTGELTYLGFFDDDGLGQPVLNGARSLAMSPDGDFLYVVSMFADSLVTLARSSVDGSLSFVNVLSDGVGGVDGLDQPRSILVSPDGKNLYVAAYDDDKVSVFSRNSTTGAASFLGVYEEGDQGVEELTDPHALAVSSDGKNVYVALWSNQVIVFSRDDSTGLLTYVSKISYLQSDSKKESIRAIRVSPDGKFVYVASTNNDAITVFSRDESAGELTHVETILKTSPSVQNLDGPHDISISADGRYLYTAVASSDSVTTFERNAETGKLTFYQSIVSSGSEEWNMNGPLSIGASPDGEHVYVGTGAVPHSLITFRREILVDPPELVVRPVDKSIEEGESVAFHGLAQGVGLQYRWLREGEEISGETSPVLTLDSVAMADDGASFQIRVSNGGGVLTSDAVTLTVLPPIVVEAPEDLTAVDVSSTSASLAWKDRSDNETNFEIQRRSPGGEFSNLATVFANQIQYADTSLSSSTTYIYRIRAKRNDTVSLWSNDAVIESFDDVPQNPVNLTVVEETYNKVILRWSDRSAVEDGFRIYRRKDQVGASWEVAGTAEKNATTFTDRGVEALATYAYRVQAYNESGASDYTNSVVAITGSIPVESISPASRTIPKDSATGYTVSVTSSKDWEALPNVSWLIVSSPQNGEGSGNQGVVYRALLNESQDERVGKIVVGGIDHTVIQEGSPPFLRIKPSRTEVSAAGGSKVVSIESNVDWSASEASEWVSINSGQAGSGYGSVLITVLANPTLETRFAELVVNGQAHTIEQAGQGVVFDASVNQSSFPAEGGEGTLSIESNIDWDASASADWIQFSESLSGNGDAELSFSVLVNETDAERSTDIIVNDEAITIVQSAPFTEEIEVIEAPAWISVNVNAVGVELSWEDRSDNESGFRIQRSLQGGGDSKIIATLGADETSFFDRDARRGKRFVYTIVAFNEDGESDEVSITSDLLPQANLTEVVMQLEASAVSEGFLAELPLVGTGELILERNGFGEEFAGFMFGSPYPTARYSLDSDTGAFRLVAAASEERLSDAYSFPDWEDGDASIRNGVRYSARSLTGSEAYPRGARVLGQLLDASSEMLVGFEIEGEAELPVLIQGVGKSLNNRLEAATVSDVRVRLYSLSGAGTLTLVASNTDWRTLSNAALIDEADAIAKTKATRNLSSDGGEARLLLMLQSGRYVVALDSLGGKTGHAMLEVFDAR